jgi:hypothetical protein
MTQTTTTNPYPDVVTAPGAATLQVRTSAVQWADGTVDDGRIEPPACVGVRRRRVKVT